MRGGAPKTLCQQNLAWTCRCPRAPSPSCSRTSKAARSCGRRTLKRCASPSRGTTPCCARPSSAPTAMSSRRWATPSARRSPSAPDAVAAALLAQLALPRSRGPTRRRSRCAWRCTPAPRKAATATTSARRSTGWRACSRPGTAGKHSCRRRPATCARRAARRGFPARPGRASTQGPGPAGAGVRASAPELAGDFPPIKSLSTHPNNLPQQLTSFIGREKEIAEVGRCSAKTRLLTLTGSGGSGKTRLACRSRPMRWSSSRTAPGWWSWRRSRTRPGAADGGDGAGGEGRAGQAHRSRR